MRSAIDRRRLHTPEVNTPATQKFRGDIEGLRAIAVVFVLIWHAGVSQLPGGFVGVDVFFVISGFLMTGILYRELSAKRAVAVGDFIRRRIKRLLPASALVLAVTAVASWLVLPASRLHSVALDEISAAFYLSNWRFADSSVNYLQQDESPSPVQHFWSLSVEEQYYLVWPALLAVAGILVARRLCSAKAVVTTLLVVITAASLAWSIYLSSADPGRAYFVTTTRAWELALGGFVAVFVVNLERAPKVLAAILAWTGLAMVLATGILLTTSLPFPGAIALVPTLGTVLLISFTPTAQTYGPARLLSVKPMVWVGGLSYSLYLWHWPFIVIGGHLITQGTREITPAEGLALVALSVAPAWLSLRYLENPIRRSDWVSAEKSNTYLLGFASMAAASAAAMVIALTVGRPAEISNVTAYIPQGGASAVAQELQPIGAAALGDEPITSPAGLPLDQYELITPDPARASNDVPPLFKDGCHADRDSTEFRTCEYADPNADHKIVLLGDSHAAQWMPPLQKIAREHGWSFESGSKSACPFVDAPLTYSDGSDYWQCREWHDAALQKLTGPDRPDAIFVSHSNYTQFSTNGREAFISGAISTLQTVQDAGTDVYIIRDTPSFPVNIAECADANRENLTRCAFPREESMVRRDSTQPIVSDSLDAPLIDLTDWICPADHCAPVIGDTLVWRDTNHMTVTYARTLSDQLDSVLISGN